MQNIETVCICGAGTMGSGIAQVAVQSGLKTIQYDISDEMLQKSKFFISANLNKLAEKQKITTEEAAQIIRKISFTNDINDCKAAIIIEAVTEQKEAKVELFNRLSAINKEDVIFATNTSSVSVSAIAAAVKFSSRVAGMHFFNPAPVMKLVEVIKTTQTDEAVVKAICTLTIQMKKVPVICNDSPGFIVNRVARQYYLQAMKLIEKGFSDFETIDAVMESAGFKMGPFKLMDLIGLDINYAVSNIIWEDLNKPNRLQPSQIQKARIEKGELGRKTGKGFYTY